MMKRAVARCFGGSACPKALSPAPEGLQVYFAELDADALGGTARAFLTAAAPVTITSVGLDDGAPVARKFPRDGAGILTSMVQSDGLVELPEELTELAPGTMVDYLPFSEIV